MKLIKLNKKDIESVDSVIERKSRFGNEADKELLHECEILWDNLRPMRMVRARCTRFVYGDQWGDLINVNGKVMTQREYLTRQGNVALQTNLMKSKVNTITGSYVKENTTPTLHARDRREQKLGEILSTTVQANWEHNDMNIMLATCLEEIVVGGICILKESFERHNGKDDAWTHMVNPNMFFFSASMQDPRFTDLSLIGEIRDYTFNGLCEAFVEKPEDYKKLKDWYYNESSPLKANDLRDVSDTLDAERMSFLSPTDSKYCRVFEVWTKERRPRYHVFDPNKGELYDINADDTELLRQIREENAARKEAAKEQGIEEELIPLIELHYFVDQYWYYRYMTPTGYILTEGESTLPGRDHPYSICAIPFINGKITPYIGDGVDQQIAINRIITLDDWIRRSGAKGVTFVPQNIIPDGMDYKTFAEQWTSMDGIVYYKPNNSGDRPFVEYGNVGTLNTSEMVRMMSDLMNDSVAVSGAIQGKTPYSGTSAALYAQQKENSSTPMASLMAKFDTFVKHAALKKTQFVQQYYTPEQYEMIAGGMEGIDPTTLALNDISQIDYDFKMAQDANTVSLRQQSNELLLQLVQIGRLDAADAIDLGEFPNGDNIVARMVERAQAQAQQAQIQPSADYQQKKQIVTGMNKGNQ